MHIPACPTFSPVLIAQNRLIAVDAGPSVLLGLQQNSLVVDVVDGGRTKECLRAAWRLILRKVLVFSGFCIGRRLSSCGFPGDWCGFLDCCNSFLDCCGFLDCCNSFLDCCNSFLDCCGFLDWRFL